MRSTLAGISLAAFALAAATGTSANLKPHYLFSDNAVLQRDAPLPVWGQALPGEGIAVTLDGLSASAVADTGGRWMARLPQHGAGGPFELVIAGATDTIRIRNVLIGDVWLCSGQSNMAFNMQDDISLARDDIAAATDSSIRQFLVSPRDLSEPQEELREGSWAPCSPATVGAFTAVGYFMARDLRAKIGVPIGIINSTVGGTHAEKWIGGPALARVPELKALVDSCSAARERHHNALLDYAADQRRYLKAAAEMRAKGGPLPKPPVPPHDYPPPLPSGHYNGMIAPLIPFALRGIAWYQGESNADDPGRYRTIFPLLVNSWRSDWGSPDLPFLYVQLANYEPTDSTRGKWAELRDVQAAALALPNTGMALAIDAGESHDIHPKNKKVVGQRLALIAEARVYGLPVEFSGPTFRSASREGGKVRVSFDHVAGGLEVRGSAINGFALAGDDNVLHPARAVISGQDVVVWSDEIPDPRQVLYAWADDPVCNLYNAARLPAAPFRARLP